MVQPGSTTAASSTGGAAAMNGPDIGHEAHQHGEDAPHDGARHADRPKPERDEGAIGGIDQNLAQEITAEPRRRVVHRGGGALHVGGAHQADQPVAQILALKQDENDEQDDDAGGGERRQHRAEHALQDLEGSRLGLADLDRDGLAGIRLVQVWAGGLARRRRGRRSGDLVLDALQRTGDLLEGSPTTPPICVMREIFSASTC